MQRQETIRRLLEQRRPAAGKVGEAMKALDSLRQRIHDLENARRHVIEKMPEGTARTALSKFSVSGWLEQIEWFSTALSKAKRRFERPHLQIGVLGRAGQGKSTLLQRLTGLDDDVIPSGNKGHCTGARSVIVHDPDAVAPFAMVHFCGTDEFLAEVIQPYYAYFSNTPEVKLGSPPTSLAEFLRADFDRPEVEKLVGDAAAKLHSLKNYQKSLDSVQSLLGATSCRVANTEIRSHIAQQDAKGVPLHRFRAVRLAEIHCRFPRADVANLCLADMPGLGDTGLGQENLLTRALAEDTDFVLWVKLPDGQRKVWLDYDVHLYTVAAKALGNLLPIREWMWVVLNRTSSNAEHCLELKRTINDQGIQVSNCVIADCSGADDALTKVLDPALEFLERRMGDLDRQYLANLQVAVDSLLVDVKRKCDEAQGLLPMAIAPLDATKHRLWTEKHAMFFGQLAQQLTELVANAFLSRHEETSEVAEAIDRILRNTSRRDGDMLVPTAKGAEELRARHGNWIVAVGLMMERARSGLTHRLQALEAPLTRSFAGAKEKVVQILVSACEGTEERSFGPNALSSLEEMAKKAGCLRIAESFRFLAEFQLTYFGAFHHRIRTQLNPLMPDESPLPQIKDGEQAVQFVWSAVDHVLFDVRLALDAMAVEPAMARFAMIEEFKDMAIRRDGVEGEWTVLTFHFKDVLWPEDFRQLEDEADLARTWTEALRAVKMHADSPAFRLCST